MFEVKQKIWHFGVFLFLLFFASCSYLFCLMLLSRLFNEVEAFRSIIFGGYSGPKIIISLFSIIAVTFSIFLTESLKLTKILPRNIASKLNRNWVIVVCIIAIVCISILLAFITNHAFYLRDVDINTFALSRGAEKNTYNSDYNLRPLSMIFSVIYPFLLLSVSYGIYAFILLFRKSQDVNYRFGYLCMAGLVLFLVVIPMYLNVTTIVFHMTSSPFSEVTGSTTKILEYKISEFTGMLFVILFSCLGIIVIHNNPFKIFKRANAEHNINFGAFLIFILFLVGANVLYHAREHIMIDNAEVRSALRGEPSPHFPQRSALDDILVLFLSNLNFSLLLLAGFITRIVRCTLLGKFTFKKNA